MAKTNSEFTPQKCRKDACETILLETIILQIFFCQESSRVVKLRIGPNPIATSGSGQDM